METTQKDMLDYDQFELPDPIDVNPKPSLPNKNITTHVTSVHCSNFNDMLLKPELNRAI